MTLQIGMESVDVRRDVFAGTIFITAMKFHSVAVIPNNNDE